MAEDTDVTSFDAQVNGAWAEFEGALAAQIGRLRDGQILGIEVDVPEQQDGASPYVQVLAFDGTACAVVVRTATWRRHTSWMNSGPVAAGVGRLCARP